MKKSKSMKKSLILCLIFAVVILTACAKTEKPAEIMENKTMSNEEKQNNESYEPAKTDTENITPIPNPKKEMAKPDVELLIKAIENNDLEKVKILTKDGVDAGAIVHFPMQEKSVLTFAVENNNIEIVRELIKAHNGGELYATDALRQIADKNSNREIVRELIKLKFSRNDSFNTPGMKLQMASVYGQLITVQELLKMGNIDKEQITFSLAQAVESNHIDLVRELIKAGADVNYIDAYEDSLLDIAAQEDNKEIFNELVKAGAQITPKALGEQLHNAIKRFDSKEVKELVEQGADINFVRWQNCGRQYSPLSRAQSLKNNSEEYIKEHSYLEDNPHEEEGMYGSETIYEEGSVTIISKKQIGLVCGSGKNTHVFSEKEEYNKRLNELKEEQKKYKESSAIVEFLKSKGATEYYKEIICRK